METLTREQLAERLAALHSASLELIKDIDIDSLLKRIAELACEQVDARYAAVGVLNEHNQLEKFIPIGMEPSDIARMAHPPQGLGLIGELMHSRQTIRIPDITADPRSAGFPDHHPVMTSFLGVPIRYGELQLGQIYLTDKTTAPEFSLDDQLVIETLAAYAAVAIFNASLYRKLTFREQTLTRRNENMALLNELSSTLVASMDIDQILNRGLTHVMEYLKLEAGEVYLKLEDGKTLQMILHRGDVYQQIGAKSEIQIGQGIIGRTASENQSILLDLDSTAHLSRDELKNMLLRPELLNTNLKQIASFPLTGRSGVVGVLIVGVSEVDSLDELDTQFISAIGSWIGMVIENVRLNVQQRRLAVLEERERIGMDLHDGVIQDIYAVGLTLEHARLLLQENPQQVGRRIEQAINDLNNTIRDIRAYILDLRPRKLHEENLMDGLRRLISEFRANTLIEVNMRGPSKGDLKLRNDQAIALFHICQEALANIAKHARASHVNVALWSTPGRVLLEVSDDGGGFDLSKVKMSIGHGLANMQTRARSAGGDVEFTSEPGSGTTILTWVPVDQEA